MIELVSYQQFVVLHLEAINIFLRKHEKSKNKDDKHVNTTTPTTTATTTLIHTQETMLR